MITEKRKRNHTHTHTHGTVVTSGTVGFMLDSKPHLFPYYLLCPHVFAHNVSEKHMWCCVGLWYGTIGRFYT